MVKRALLWQISALCAAAASCLASPRGWVEIKPKIQSVGAVYGEVRDAAGRRYGVKSDNSGLVLWGGKAWKDVPLHADGWRPEIRPNASRSR